MTDTPKTPKPDPTPDAKPDPVPDNETMREVKRAKARKAAVEEKSSISWKTAAGVGIGSAALVAALLYANKARKKDGKG
jgi:hypothetical protein